MAWIAVLHAVDRLLSVGDPHLHLDAVAAQMGAGKGGGVCLGIVAPGIAPAVTDSVTAIIGVIAEVPPLAVVDPQIIAEL